MRNVAVRKISHESLPFAEATHYYPAEYDAKIYRERTKRNQLWLGGEIGQKKLQALKIGVAGLGGIGSNVAEALVRMGVGHLRITDPDRLDVSNINRQVIANRRTVGQSKAAASAAELRNIAQDFELVVYEQGFTEEMAEEFVEGCDAIVGEIDVSVLDKYVVLHRAAIKRNIPIYSSYVVGLGIHFFKFHGAQYTFEDFMGVPEAKWRKPDLDLIFKLFGEPYPSYLNEKQIQNYKGEAARDGIPIFGPATLLGHNLVTTRMILDLMRNQMQIGQFPETPTMPEFLVLDPVDLTFKVERIKE